jgi:hypothetical protein
MVKWFINYSLLLFLYLFDGLEYVFLCNLHILVVL